MSFTAILAILSLKTAPSRSWCILGDAPDQKLPIAPALLLLIGPERTANEDYGFWAAMLIDFNAFFW